jgi:predicted ATP-grasp superfamily ATP-dependent carboligase
MVMVAGKISSAHVVSKLKCELVGEKAFWYTYMPDLMIVMNDLINGVW